MPEYFEIITDILRDDSTFSQQRLEKIGSDEGLLIMNRGQHHIISMFYYEHNITLEMNQRAASALQFLNNTAYMQTNSVAKDNLIYFLFLHLNAQQQTDFMRKLHASDSSFRAQNNLNLNNLVWNILRREKPLMALDSFARNILPNKSPEFREQLWDFCIKMELTDAHLSLLFVLGEDRSFSQYLQYVGPKLFTSDAKYKLNRLMLNYLPHISYRQFAQYLSVLETATRTGDEQVNNNNRDFYEELTNKFDQECYGHPYFVLDKIKLSLQQYNVSQDLKDITIFNNYLAELDVHEFDMSTGMYNDDLVNLLNHPVLEAQRMSGAFYITLFLFRHLDYASQQEYLQKISHEPMLGQFVYEIIQYSGSSELSRYAIRFLTDAAKEELFKTAFKNYHSDVCMVFLEQGIGLNSRNDFILNFMQLQPRSLHYSLEQNLEIFLFYLQHTEIPRMQAFHLMYCAEKYQNLLIQYDELDDIFKELRAAYFVKYPNESHFLPLSFNAETTIPSAVQITKDDLKDILQGAIYTEIPVYEAYEKNQSNENIFATQFAAIIQAIKQWAIQHNCIGVNSLDIFWDNILASIQTQNIVPVPGQRPPVNMYYALNFNPDIKQSLERIYAYLHSNEISEHHKKEYLTELLSSLDVCGPGVNEAIKSCELNFQDNNLNTIVLKFRQAIAAEALTETLIEYGLKNDTTLQEYVNNRHTVMWLHNMLSNDDQLGVVNANILGTTKYNDPFNPEENLKLAIVQVAMQRGLTDNEDQLFNQFKREISDNYRAEHTIDALVGNVIDKITQVMNETESVEQQLRQYPAVKQLFANVGLLAPGGKLLPGILIEHPLSEVLKDILSDYYMGDFTVLLKNANEYTAFNYAPGTILFEVDDHNNLRYRFLYQNQKYDFSIVTTAEIAQGIKDNDASKIQDIFNAILLAPKLDINMVKYYVSLNMIHANLLDPQEELPLLLLGSDANIEVLTFSKYTYLFFHDKDPSGEARVRCLHSRFLSDAEYEILKQALTIIDTKQLDRVTAALVANDNLDLILRLYGDVPRINLVTALLRTKADTFEKIIEFIFNLDLETKNFMVLALFNDHHEPLFGVELVGAILAKGDDGLMALLTPAITERALLATDIDDTQTLAGRVASSYKLYYNYIQQPETLNGYLLSFSLTLISPRLMEFALNKLINDNLLTENLILKICQAIIGSYSALTAVRKLDALYATLNSRDLDANAMLRSAFAEINNHKPIPADFKQWLANKDATVLNSPKPQPGKF